MYNLLSTYGGASKELEIDGFDAWEMYFKGIVSALEISSL